MSKKELTSIMQSTVEIKKSEKPLAIAPKPKTIHHFIINIQTAFIFMLFFRVLMNSEAKKESSVRFEIL